MSAGLLREAAMVMRERAETATPGPWRVGDGQLTAGVGRNGACAYCHLGQPTWEGQRDINGTTMLAHTHPNESPWPHGIYAERADGSLNIVNDTDEYGYMREGDAEHIASWHPAVALAVADWLDVARENWRHGVDRNYDAALAVARAYLGRSA